MGVVGDFIADPVGTTSHAVRGTVRSAERAVGTRDDAGDQQQAAAAQQQADMAAYYQSLSPEQMAERARLEGQAAGPTYLQKWESAMPTSYQLGGSADTANQYAASAQQTGQQAQSYLNQAAQQSQGVGYEFGQQLADAGNAAQQFGQNVGEAAMGFGQQQAYNLGQMGQGYQAQANSAQGRDVGDPNFRAMNRNLNEADPNFAASRVALGQSRGYTQGLAGIEAQEGPSAAQAQLRAGLNASQASNVALARSGRGWGSSANAMAQAQSANAAAGQGAANQAAALRAQETAAYRQRAAANLGQAAGLSQGVASQLGQQQQAETQAALGRAGLQMNQQQLASQAALQNAAQNDAYSQSMAGLGLSAQQSAAQTGLSGFDVGGGLAQQGYGQQMAGLEGGGNMQLSGLGQSGQLTAQGGMINLSAQQQALAAQQQQVANNMAYQNQMIGLHQGNQNYQAGQAALNANASQFGQQRVDAYISAGLEGLGTAAALSDRDKKKDIEPANKNVLVPAQVEDIDSMAAAETLMNRPNPYTDDAAMARAQYQFGGGPMPFEQGVGISGPNQMQGPGASNAAAMAASAQSPNSGGEEKPGKAAQFAKGLNFRPAQPGPVMVPAPFMSQQTAVPQPTMPALSDKNAKYAISDEDAKEALDKTPAYSYRYKDPEAMGADEGLQFGIMAQDLEKTPAGRSVVKKQPDGTRMVDTSRLALMEAGAVNALSKEVAEIKRLIGKGKAA